MSDTENESRPIRVLIVDDQQLVRSGFAMMLSVEDDIDVVGEVADGSRALELARLHRPDLILMDVQMPVMDGIEATRVVVDEALAKVVILTTFDRDDYLFDALRAGASGFLLKNAGPEQLLEAIRAVADGHALLAPEVTRRVIAAMTAGAATTDGPTHGEPGSGNGAHGIRTPAGEHLTEREAEVLTLVARGLSNAEIARELFLGEATIKTHVSNCLSKLQVRDRVQLVVYAFEHGLTS
ncbi:MAG: response regulator transcription factor [Actinobacteria bacterium]|nr:response regulator transcription factor [Actinomycetota bacterium]